MGSHRIEVDIATRRTRLVELVFAGLMVLGLILAAVACSGNTGPWYDTAPDPDLSYLPWGDYEVEETSVDYMVDGSAITADAYLPVGSRGPVAVMLPGAFVVKQRYRWLGVTLASHGVATFVVQPRGSFAHSGYTVELLAALADDARVDTSRVLLVGHSAGALPQVGLTDVASCPEGFCKPEHRTPRALRGLILLGYHNQNTLDDDTPMPAAESPWLIINGTRDGLATAEKLDVTFDRIQDRPLYRVDVVGANHYQLTDYVDPDVDLRLADDLEPTVSNREARATAAAYVAAFARRYGMADTAVAEDLGSEGDDRVVATIRLPRVVAPTGHDLPRVLSEPLDMVGLTADEANTAVTASARYGDYLYLLIRNDVTGAQVWRIGDDMTAERVAFPDGHTGGFYGNTALNGLLGAMAVYKGELYVGVSSGFQGAALGSVGAELWAYDGGSWRPVVSHRVDADDQLTLTSCSEAGGDTASLQFAGAAFSPGSLVGAVVDDIGSPSAGAERNILFVTGNTADTVTVTRNDVAHEPEAVDCSRLVSGHVLYLRRGSDENGFGQPWNKAITAMTVVGERLYVGSGFNYHDGAELYVTDNGIDFAVAVSRQLLGAHADGVPISSSISAMHASAVGSEDEILYVGTTGTADYGARLLAVTKDGIDFIVDDAVDGDGVGLDEAGNGVGNHQIMAMADYDGRLWFVGLNFGGLAIYSSDRPRDVASWRVEVGEGGRFAAGWGDGSQLAARLRVHDDQLWISSVAFIQHKSELAEKSGLSWRVDGDDWQLISAHAFGVNSVSVADVYPVGDALVGVAANGSLASAGSFGGLRFYTLD